MELTRLSRREFLKDSAAAGGAMALGGLFPGSVLGANDRINFGSIGVGNQGTSHLHSLIGRSEADNIRVVAVSDVYKKYLDRAVHLTDGKAEGFSDYRKLLERKDIDAVLIATPDHWHAKMAIEAMQAGKHVYLEKPMTKTVEQAITVRNTARRLNRVLQIGPQVTAEDSCWKAHEAIKSGRIGKVSWAQGSYNRNAHVEAINAPPFTIDPAAGPQATGDEYIDWDMWLGWQFDLAPKIPYNAEHFFRWRKYWPYSNGMGTDLLFHRLAPLLIAIAGPDGEYPRRVSSGGGLYIEKDGREIPDVCLVTIDYPSEYTIFLVTALTNDTQLPLRIYGKFGTLDLETDPELRYNGEFEDEFKQRNDGYAEVRIPHQERRDMEGNFIDVIRGKGTLNCNPELGAATLVALKMGVDAYRQNKTLLWDANKEQVI